MREVCNYSIYSPTIYDTLLSEIAKRLNLDYPIEYYNTDELQALLRGKSVLIPDRRKGVAW
jgi:hypothetical protein